MKGAFKTKIKTIKCQFTYLCDNFLTLAT